jgi:hypothetical protein
MRIVGVLGVALAGLSVICAVTAYGQIDKRSQYAGTTAAVVDDKGNLRAPSDYRTVYQMLGSWAVAKDDGSGLKGDARGLCIARNHRRISQGWTLFPMAPFS